MTVLCCADEMITRDNGATNIAHNDAAANDFADAISANYCSSVH
jgi:hypothetical protein